MGREAYAIRGAWGKKYMPLKGHEERSLYHPRVDGERSMSSGGAWRERPMSSESG